MYKHVIGWNEPRDILQNLPDIGRAEMSESQHAFLCGLLREKCPQKVLEVGVAAGWHFLRNHECFGKNMSTGGVLVLRGLLRKIWPR